MLLLMIACVGAPAQTETDTGGLLDSEPQQDDTGAPAGRCPEGMVAIGDPVALCMDAYEAQLSGDLGSADQWAAGGSPTLATATTAPGVLPSTGMSFDQAKAACENTPALDDQGVAYGYKHMPTVSEWEDAADGVVGEGGLTYPYGDSYEVEACALVPMDNVPLVDALQPTGSFPDCVSPWGTYDQIGNAWEWVDPALNADIQLFLETAESLGLELFESSDGLLGAKSSYSLLVDIAGAQGTWSLDAQGLLMLDASQFHSNEQLTYKGYAHVRSELDRPLDERTVPIQGVQQEDGSLKVRLLHEDDGVPFTDKRGGAWYSGGAATNHEAYNGHYHDFDGTIGVRCAALPY
ncbi:MAG: SUMF1/EgtB/PvdO family nonheme iron enzyme [Myxococcota bacterium]|nr:SUMF1/EgtB/PvdO family nonheme iron enzyme [Myxococcota bacterium]